MGLKAAIPGLGDKSHHDRIKIFGWWLHVHQDRPWWAGRDIAKCYRELHFAPPAGYGAYLKTLVERKEPLQGSGGYKLEHKVRDQLDAAYGQSPATVIVNTALATLAEKIPGMAERDYFKEMMICYKGGAFRPAVTSTWNIAFAHLCDHVIASRLQDFNDRWQYAYPGMHKPKPLTVSTMDDFNEHLKESQMITICKDAGIITRNIYNVMDPALKRRNAAAHPSSVMIDKMQADAYIVDLINNVVLKIG